MSDPEYPDDECVKVLRSTISVFLRAQPTQEQLLGQIVAALYAIKTAGAQQDWGAVAAQAGLIASMALVVQLDAMARMPPKGPRH